MADTGPTFDADGDGIVTFWDSATAQASFDLETIINAKPADLTLDYDLDLASSVTVTNDTNQPNQKVQADLILILPLTFVATSAAGGTAELLIGDSMPTSDLFGRSETGNNTDINRAFDSLLSMTLSLKINNSTGLVGQASLVKAPGFTKTLTLPATTGEVELQLDQADIEYIKATIPFNPTLNVGIPGSPGGTSYSLQRGGGISANIVVKTVTDIDETYNLRGTN